jgi:hypothetical protein
MIGASPNEVIVKPAPSFVEVALSEEAKALVETWRNGAISYQTL